MNSAIDAGGVPALRGGGKGEDGNERSTKVGLSGEKIWVGASAGCCIPEEELSPSAGVRRPAASSLCRSRPPPSPPMNSPQGHVSANGPAEGFTNKSTHLFRGASYTGPGRPANQTLAAMA